MNLLYPLRAARDRHANSPAIITEDGALTWREFYEAVECSASFLGAAGFDRGERIAVLLSNGPVFLELYYSTAMSGIVIVPLNTRWGIEDFVFSMVDSGAKALVVDHRFGEIARQIRARVPGLILIYSGRNEPPDDMIDYRAGVAWSSRADLPEPAPEDIAGIFYTSGTTGGPKGAMLTHRNLYANAMNCYATGLRLGSVYLHAAPMFHLADGTATHCATLSGTTHCFIETFDPAAVLGAIEKYRVTSTILVPTMINLVVNCPDISKRDLSSLEVILYGASPMPITLLITAMQKLGCKFLQAYGMTETSPVLTMLFPEDHRLDDLNAAFTPVRSAGKPILGMEVRVVDFNDKELPAGQAGEVVARGDNVMKGYWNRPEINAVVLRGGWMHTGDLGAFDQHGFLYILDRTKDMIKTGSENVYSPEVEAAIVAHRDVLEAAVIGVPHQHWGETIRAIVVVRPGASCSEAAIIEHCRARMTHFKCPTSVVFIEALPKGGTGKVQKQMLRKMFGAAGAAASGDF